MVVATTTSCPKMHHYQLIFLLSLIASIFYILLLHPIKILPNLRQFQVEPDRSLLNWPQDSILHGDKKTCRKSELHHFSNGSIDFDGFDNETGTLTGCYIVPNIVHLIKFNQPMFEFYEVICMASIFNNHNPDYVIIHTNQNSFEGKYWRYIKRLPNANKIVIKYLEQPTTVYNISMSTGFRNWHASDVCRLQLLKKYGGIYFDTDVYVVNNLNKYRAFEFSVEWNDGMFLGSQTLIGNKDARVLDPWLETYKNYKPKLWYFNGGILPTKAVLMPYPWLIHRVKDCFGSSTAMLGFLYDELIEHENLKPWREYDVIHLFIHHQSFEFNETSVFKYHNSRIKEMILEVMPSYMYPDYDNLH